MREQFLPIVEKFYSIQGEGFHTGKAAYFLRIGGCDVGCHWCDEKRSWNSEDWDMIDVKKIVQHAAQYPARAVVVTGGEPLMWNLDYICRLFDRYGIQKFLETSGSHPLSGTWDWICLSPKKSATTLPNLLHAANELKIIIETERDFIWAEKQASLVSAACKLWLQPEWGRSQKMIPVIVDYILVHPQWAISLQSHKYMRIP